jgi:NhaP-type Na+/H+ or K+/H+ antiporter
MYESLAILAAFVVIYSLIGGRLERTPVSGALVYTTFGLAVGPVGLGLLDLQVSAEGLRTLAELTLALVLFTDAANADLKILRRGFRIPQRLLLIGLPLTILLGWVVGMLLFGSLTPLEAAILATMVAPTDAALGKAVVSNQAVPAPVREGLNVESGLNDGLCVPILFVLLTLAAGAAGDQSPSTLALGFAAEEIGIGAGAGLVVTLLGAGLLKLCADRGWVTETWRQLPVPAFAVTCFASAQALGGSGFIAAFAGGLLFGALAKQRKHGLMIAAEGSGDTLALITWVAFGSAVIGQMAGDFGWQSWLYALLSLTVIRMLPAFLALAGISLRTDEKLFIGWFGPRGLASVVFAVIVFNQGLPGSQPIVAAVACTIILSIIAHGLTAYPSSVLLGANVRRSAG